MKVKQFIGAVSALAISAMPLAVSDSLSAHAERKSSYEFYLAGQYDTNGGFWSPNQRGNSPVIVSEDNKEYTLKVSGYSGQVQAEDLILYIQSNVNVNDYGNGTDENDGIRNGSINVEISSIKVDGQPVNYTRSEGALTVGNTLSDLRLNIYNQHQRPQGTLDIDPNFIVSSEIEVTFQTAGLFIEEPSTEAPAVSTDNESDSIATDVTPATTAPPPATTQAVVATTAVALLDDETIPVVKSADVDTNAYTIGDRNYIFIFLLAIVSCLAVIISKCCQSKKRK